MNIVYKGDLCHLQKQYEYLHRCLVFSLMSFSNIVTDLTVSTIVTCATDNFYTNIHKVNTHHYTENYPYYKSYESLPIKELVSRPDQTREVVTYNSNTN